MTTSSAANELFDLLQQSREYACYLRELGVETVATTETRTTVESQSIPRDASAVRLPAPRERQSVPVAERRRPTETSAQIGVSTPTKTEPRLQDSLFVDLITPEPSLVPSSETLEAIWCDIGDCTRCALCEGRTQVVNTHGHPKARLMFVGEAPGADEDAQGKPFVGRAGQLLTKIIEAIGFKREDVLIGNVNRCRPPGNRQPTLEEAAICRPFLFREIAAVQPDVIVVLGNTALRNLLETREGITRVRGRFQDFRGIKVMPTFHPAYLLRDPSKKRETWEDLKKVRDYLDSLPPKRSER